MHLVIAALAFGALVTFFVPWATRTLTPYVPGTLLSNPVSQVAFAGGIIVLGLFVAHKAGFAKYFRVAA